MMSVPYNNNSSIYSTNIIESKKDPRSSSSSSKAPHPGGVCCCLRKKHDGYVPKLEAFSRSKLERGVKDPPLIQKSENQLADYCSVFDGEASYDCWKAYFELKDLEKESPKQEVERLIIQAGGMKSLIGCLHGIAEIHKGKKESSNYNSPNTSTNSEQQTRVRANCPIPDGLPKSREELEEEEEGRMPDSPFTRLLRTKGTHPAWYSPSLD